MPNPTPPRYTAHSFSNGLTCDHCVCPTNKEPIGYTRSRHKANRLAAQLNKLAALETQLAALRAENQRLSDIVNGRQVIAPDGDPSGEPVPEEYGK